VNQLLLLHAGSTLMMTGLVWFVQLVHYPLFPFAALGNFPAFERAHQRRTNWLVTPLMLTELATAVALFVSMRGPLSSLAGWGLALLAVIWISTAAIQVPLHRRLTRGFDDRFVALLVRSNWLRTSTWSARSVIALTLVTS
jgi:hypothetical protein